ncbi:TetR/AcrR family transcriptional regulator C-terminal domain-containing protein [Actinoplanes sp. NBC_00393]|uniref:TetR/AcrR family transcriptional regulator C-terminal domain-containing protein n=1 Tax=Actinoplanes sp. NBC_00393 TaxID=2975953 RepID=UPI002E1DE261
MPDTAPRRRGRPARIDRARIVAAARDMDPQTLTMQAVAERLGVDRKALNYHVSDREGLLELVALDVLSGEVSEIPMPAGGDWRDQLRAFAHNMRAGLVRTGALFEYVRMPVAGGLAGIAAAEKLMESLVAAGFAERDAGRAIGFVAEFVFSSARDAVMIERFGEHPQVTELRKALDRVPEDQHRTLRRMMTGHFRANDEQLEFDLQVCIAGLEQILAKQI